MKTWSYLINPFLTATENSQRSMKKICNFSINALKAQPTDVFLAARLVILSPFVTQYNLLFDTWFNNQAAQLGQSANLKDLLIQLRSQKIRDWDIAIQVVYKSGTPQYIALLPHHRTPFQKGSQLDIMGAVSTLSLSINNDVALADVKADVDAFYILLKDAYEAQKSSIAGTGNGSDALETQRISVSTQLYSLLGLLMDYYKETPEKTGNLFDLQTIRNHEQSIFKSNIAANETLLAMTHTFDADEEMIFINRGKTALAVALLPDENSPMGIKIITIAANSKQLIKLQDLADITTCRFLKVQNLSDLLEGAYTIELI